MITACSLDWAIRAEPGDASVLEAGPDVADARDDDDAAEASLADAPDPDSGPCQALAEDLTARKAKARECQIGQAGQCTTTVDDECGCKVIVRTGGSVESTAYTDGIAAFVTACGKPPAASCACPQLGLPAGWACLANDSMIACRPP